MKSFTVFIFLAFLSNGAFASNSDVIIKSDDTFGQSMRVCMEGSCEDFEGAISAKFEKGNKVLILKYEGDKEKAYSWAKMKFIPQKVSAKKPAKKENSAQ